MKTTLSRLGKTNNGLKTEMAKDTKTNLIHWKKELKEGETNLIKNLSNLTGLAETIGKANMLKNHEFGEGDRKAIINYDAEFKILIANQKIQIAAETSDIFK
jgi:hypothetical protein